MKILETIYEFNNDGKSYGLYHIQLDSGNKHYFIRNNDSVGVITHYFGKSASECVSIIRDDRKQEFFNLLRRVKVNG